ncbi:hypothetical protein MBLNU459_g0490t1 [Dothideomycetes sp. NU459]
MERVRKFWQQEQPYEPIEGGSVEEEREREELRKSGGFSWIEYFIFLLLGVSMLWAWNMLLAAGPYFQRRFEKSAWVTDNFQAAELSVSSITSLVSMLVLAKMQKGASYPRRIIISLVINFVAFTLLALSTWIFLGASANAYFVFLIFIVFSTSLATGLCQNGIFAFVSGFGHREYTQAIMTGQGVAGVLPCIAQIVSVLSVPKRPHIKNPHGPPAGTPGGPPVPGKAASAYFLTATVISVITLIAFIYLLRRHNLQKPEIMQEDLSTSTDSLDRGKKKVVPLLVLFSKLRWLASAVFITFAVTMEFPVFTQRILSVRPIATAPALFQPPSFIPLAFLFWNSGDLIGRLIPAVPRLSLTSRPKIVLCLAVARFVFIPLYQLCNVRGQGAVISSDAFYLVVVQLLFGLSNGYLGSICMMGAAEWVDEEEKEAAGGFMGLCLVAGLTVGSFASFFAARA